MIVLCKETLGKNNHIFIQGYLTKCNSTQGNIEVKKRLWKQKTSLSFLEE